MIKQVYKNGQVPAAIYAHHRMLIIELDVRIIITNIFIKFGEVLMKTV